MKLWMHSVLTALIASFIATAATAQPALPKKHSGPFRDILLIDNQTVFVPQKNTLELELQQRFGTVDHGFRDLFGLYGPSNTRIGVYYVPVHRLLLGAGVTKEDMQLGLEAKYNLIPYGQIPFAVSYFFNGSIQMISEPYQLEYKDRLSFFHQLLLASNVTEKLALQLAPSVAHFNKISKHTEEHLVFDTTTLTHVAVSLSGQYSLARAVDLIMEFDQPLTRHQQANPHPNVSLGLRFSKNTYSFQVFMENYYNIDAQVSNMYNDNDFAKGQFLIGFNLSKSWHWKKQKQHSGH